jgi:hypothetical protein
MLALAIGLALVIGQTPDFEETVGKIETIDRAARVVGVRDVASGKRKLFYFNKDTSVTREDKPSSTDKLRIADTVSMKWVLKGSRPNEKRILGSVEVRRVLNPAKLKIQDTGYLPLQDDNYHFVVLAHVDPMTVLVQERITVAEPQFSNLRRQRTITGIDTTVKKGEELILRQVTASDFPVGKRVSIDGKWQVKTSDSAQVTKTGDIITRKTNSAGNTKRQNNLRKDEKSDESGQSNGAFSTQTDRTTTVSAFVLEPVKAN